MVFFRGYLATKTESNGIALTGKAVAFRDVTILKLRDGKIIESRGLSDYLTMFQQLSMIP